MKKNIYSLFSIIVVLQFSCASVVRSTNNPNNIPDNQLSLIATAGANQAKFGNGSISSIDGKSANGWKFKTAAGWHEIVINGYGNTNILNNRAFKFRLLTEAGKRYDILTTGDAFVRNRDVASDNEFIGSDLSKPFTMLSANPEGIFMGPTLAEKDRQEARQRTEKEIKESAEKRRFLNSEKERIESERKKSALDAKVLAENAKILFVQRKGVIGEKICRVSQENSSRTSEVIILGVRHYPKYSGKITLVGFVEAENNEKINITISAINFSRLQWDAGVEPNNSEYLDQTIYKGSDLRINSKIWDDKLGWYACP